ncbi:sigma-70 family RNA polymerase sigma factor [Candidatus Daviesbacteria bacterium]|nr:sigma-70 family RNA polymerase sigma factor [Candidatus Daviesbacteria bacterium]
MQSSDIRKLINQAQKGDKDAFGQIYKLYLKKIYRFVYFSVRNKELAEDLTQTTFYKAWISLPKFSVEEGTIQAFLFTIARHLIIDESRKKKEISATSFGEGFEQFLSDDPGPEELAFKQEIKDFVWHALRKLKTSERNIIVLRFFEELEYSEIAQIIGKKEGAIRVMIHRILLKLKGQVEDQ